MLWEKCYGNHVFDWPQFSQFKKSRGDRNHWNLFPPAPENCFFVGDTSLSGLQGCKCFVFQWFRLTTPRICGNGGCLLSSQKITEIPGVFLQKWRSELFVACGFWWWPAVFFWYVHVFLANKLLLFHLMFWPRFSWCRCWSHVGNQHQVAGSTVEPCRFSGVVQNFWWWRSGEDCREGRNGCTDAWLLVKICERKTIEIVEKMSQNWKKLVA